MVFGDDHDFKKWPELSNSQIAEIGFTSPHQQIVEDFEAEVVKVHDGDTVTLRCDFRDFDFPLRFASVDAPELNTGVPGQEARDFVKGQIEGEMVKIKMDRKNRVGKYGRLLGDVEVQGIKISDTMLQLGYALPFDRRREGTIPDFNLLMKQGQWVS